jgi:hypothetical protein
LTTFEKAYNIFQEVNFENDQAVYANAIHHTPDDVSIFFCQNNVQRGPP